MNNIFIQFFEFFMSIWNNVANFFEPVVDFVITAGTTLFNALVWLLEHIVALIEWIVGLFSGGA